MVGMEHRDFKRREKEMLIATGSGVGWTKRRVPCREITSHSIQWIEWRFEKHG
jgi:hypothetical protein